MLTFPPASFLAHAVPDAASRTAIFATINSTSAFAILILQVLATGEGSRVQPVCAPLAAVPGPRRAWACAWACTAVRSSAPMRSPADCPPACLVLPPTAGHVLRHLGLPIALSVLPTSAGVLLAVIAAWPAPVTVAAAEVCRKLLAYSLARPARESLYTVLSREEKCE